MNATRARRRIRELGRARRVRFTGYAALRMLQRGVAAAEVFRVLTTAQRCYAQANERWRLVGEDLMVVVELTDEAVVVVTSFRGDEDANQDEEA